MTRRNPDRPAQGAARAACDEPRHQVSDTIAAESLAERVLRNSRGDRVTLLNYGARLAACAGRALFADDALPLHSGRLSVTNQLSSREIYRRLLQQESK
jgi:hypothetical protein